MKMGGKESQRERHGIHTEMIGGVDKRAAENRGGDAASWLNLENSEGFT